MATYTIAISRANDNEFVFLDQQPPLDSAIRGMYFIYTITAPTLDDAVTEAKQKRMRQLGTQTNTETMLVDNYA